MWLVLRSTRAQNKLLKKFVGSCNTVKIGLNDIVKFGRVNFKIAEMVSDNVNKDYNILNVAEEP